MTVREISLPILFFFYQVLTYSKQFLPSIKTCHSQRHLFLLSLVSLSFSSWSQTQWDWDHYFQDSSEPFCLQSDPMHHTQYPGCYCFSSWLLIAHREWESNPISELQASGLPYLVCFIKQPIHKKFNSLATTGLLDVCTRFKNNAVIFIHVLFVIVWFIKDSSEQCH